MGPLRIQKVNGCAGALVQFEPGAEPVFVADPQWVGFDFDGTLARDDEEGHFEQSKNLFVASLGLFYELGSKAGIAQILDGLANFIHALLAEAPERGDFTGIERAQWGLQRQHPHHSCRESR